MNRNIRFVAPILSAFIVGITTGFLLLPTKKTINPELSNQALIKTVAILQPISHPALEQIKEGFKTQLKKELGAETIIFQEYNGNGNNTLLRSQAEEIVHSTPDLIFTIATGPALLVKELTIRKNNYIPMVCGAAAKEKLFLPGETIKHITGTDDMIFQEQQLKMLKFLKPTAEKLLLVYDGNSAGLEKSINEIEQKAKKLNLTITKLPVFGVHEIAQKTAPFINEVDTVLILKDNLVVSGLDILVKLCNTKGITLFASDLDSVDRGAALAFGVSEYEIGVQSAHQAATILAEGIEPNVIPFAIVSNANIKLNKKTASTQGLIVSPDIQFILGHGQLYERK